MFGLDDRIAHASNGTTLVLVLAVSVALGLRHASDPDHLAAVTTLIASGRERAGRRAAVLGAFWGCGHATTLFLFGVPIVLYRAYLPEAVQSGAEIAVGALIVGLARSLAVHLAPVAELFSIYIVMAVVLMIRPEGLFQQTQARKI